MEKLLEKTVLIVDDDIAIREYLKKFMEKLDFTVYLAVDGEDAVRNIKKHKFDLLLLDLFMPYIDGEQLVKILEKRNLKIPVIVVSGHLTKDNIARLMKMNIRNFIAKPVDPHKLYEEIEKVM